LLGLHIAAAALIIVRATSANFVPVWSFWWWVWIIATVAVSWLAGFVAYMVAVQKGWLRVRYVAGHRGGVAGSDR
jgi:hypothetical protein